MAKKRAKRRGRSRDAKLDDIEEASADAASRKPRKPRRRKRDSDRGGGGAGGSSRRGYWGFASVIIIVILLLMSHYVYNTWFKEEEKGFDEDVTILGGAGAVSLKILSDGTHKFAADSAQDSHIDGKASFLLLLKNKGNERARFDVEASDPDGWTVSMSKDFVGLDADQTDIIILKVRPGDDVDPGQTVTVSVRAIQQEDEAVWDKVEAEVTAEDLGENPAVKNDLLSLQYVLVDRGSDDEYDKNTWVVSQTSWDAQPFEATAGGSDTIPGFASAMVGMREGETKSFLIPDAEAYGSDKTDGKPDGDLYYELTLLEIL